MKKYYIVLEYILRLIASTWQFTVNKDIPPSPAIIAFWHGRMLPIWKFFSKKKSFAIVSLNKDGEILSHLLQKWHFNLIRGSSSKKGKEVIQTVTDTDENTYFLITPDGPRGPAQKAKVGAFVMAQKKQIPVYFISCTIKRKKIFHKSWDNFEFPLLFSKIELNISDKIIIPPDSSCDDITNHVLAIDKMS